MLQHAESPGVTSTSTGWNGSTGSVRRSASPLGPRPFPPHWSLRIAIVDQGLGLDLDTVARCCWGQIMTLAQANRMQKVLVQMVDKLDHPVLQRCRNGDVIKDREVLHVFTEAHSPRMRTNRDLKFGGHQKNDEDFVH